MLGLFREGVPKQCVTIIIIINLSFLARINKKNLAQKRLTEESLVVINLEQICLEVSF